MKELSAKAIATREKILRTTDELFYLHGYNATGLDLIIKTAGVTKGNFYYYFKSKEALAVETLEWHFTKVTLEIQQALSGETLTARETLFSILNVIKERQKSQHQEGHICGCFFGNFTLELSSGSPTIRNKLDEIFSRYRDNFTQLISEAQKAGEIPNHLKADEEAETVLSLMEGALLLDKARHAPKALPQAIHFLKAHLNTG